MRPDGRAGPARGKPIQGAGSGDRRPENWTPVWVVLGLGCFIWASGCLKRKVVTPVPVTSAPAADAAGRVVADKEPGRARAPRPFITEPAAPAGRPAKAQQVALPPVPTGPPLRGLPEPLGNRTTSGPEPLWRARAKNY